MIAPAPRGILRLDAADLVASAGAATPLAELEDALAARGAWVALDPPGARDQSLGSVLERGAAGPLAALYGPPRDQVIGLTFIAGNGTTVRTGGRVVKNVAGFDLAKVVIGGHGAFGTILEAHLRLRARPEADESRAWSGSLDDMAVVTARIMAAGAAPAALECLGPGLSGSLGTGNRWTLAARSLGTPAGAREELDVVAEPARGALEPVPAPEPFWRTWRETVGAWPVALRIGADPSRWDAAARLAMSLGARDCSVTVPRGTVRVRFGEADLRPVTELRAEAANRGWPVTIERAPLELLRAAGIWGAMNDGTRRLAAALRATLGPEGSQAVPLWA